MKIRINNIEFRKSFERYEIVKWYANSYFNKLNEYLDDGHIIDGGFVRKNNVSISLSFFNSEENCYTIAILEYNHKEPDIDLRSIGSRILDLTNEERDDFFEVYRIANEKILKLCQESETKII